MRRSEFGLEESEIGPIAEEKIRVVACLFFTSLVLCFSFFLSFFLSFSLFVCVCVYEVCKVPSSYRQPIGRGQSLSRRYCKQSGWSFL